MFVVTTNSPSGIGYGVATMNGSWTGATDGVWIGEPEGTFDVDAKFNFGYGSAYEDQSPTRYKTEDGSHSFGLTGLDPDRTLVYNFRGKDIWAVGGGSFIGGADVSFLTFAGSMSFGTPTSSNITASAANIAIQFNPNTNESVAEVKGQYRVKSPPGSWIDTDTIYSQRGTDSRNIQFNLSGLTPGTTYEFRFVAVRNTANETSLTSAISEFTTLTDILKLNIAEIITFVEGTNLPSPNKFLSASDSFSINETVTFVVGEQSTPVWVQTIGFGISYVRGQ